MAPVTLPGIGGATITIPYQTAQSTQAATSLLQNVYLALRNESLFQQIASANTPPPPAGTLGELVIDGSLPNVSAPVGDALIVDASPANPVTVAGSAQANESVFAGSSDLTFYTDGGSGTIIGGDGNNLIASPTSNGGSWDLDLQGVGSTTVFGGAANDEILSANGRNLLFLGSGQDTVFSSGTDTIVGGSGAETVATGAPQSWVFAGSGSALLVNSGGADTFSAGSGAETIFAGASGGLYFLNTSPNLIFASIGAYANTIVGAAGNATVFGGSGSNLIFGNDENLVVNLQSSAGTIVGGAGNTTVYAGTGGNQVMFQGSGALLYDAQSSTSTLISNPNSPGAEIFASDGGSVALWGSNNGNTFIAGPGNVTLQGGGATGANVYFAGTGADVLVAGSGNDTLVAGTGDATMVGGAGRDQFVFINGAAGGSVLIENYNPSDQLSLFGYGNSSIVSSQVMGGSLVLTLSDHTTITLQGINPFSSAQVHEL
jgi:serralysin